MTMVSMKKPESIWKTKFAEQRRKRIYFKKINKINKISNGLFTGYPHKKDVALHLCRPTILII